MWNDFFYYSKADKRAILLLLFLICLLLVGGAWYALSRVPVECDEDRTEAEAFLNTVRKQEKSKTGSTTYRNRSSEVPVLAPFDPNTADSVTLVRLGLPPFMARNILRYRAKGGVFRSVESFAKVYGLTTEQYETLRPYIRIQETALLPQRDTTQHQQRLLQVDSLRTLKFPEGTVVDLNEADTTTLKKVPGIGSAYARQIVAYRARLGGFYSVAQLQELPFSSKELAGWFKIEETPTSWVKVNEWSVEHLRSHPYLNFYQAKVIVEHRKKYGKLKSLSQLSLYKEFTEKDFKRLSPYLSFD